MAAGKAAAAIGPSVVAYIAGQQTPEGKRMGHAGGLNPARAWPYPKLRQALWTSCEEFFESNPDFSTALHAVFQV